MAAQVAYCPRMKDRMSDHAQSDLIMQPHSLNSLDGLDAMLNDNLDKVLSFLSSGLGFHESTSVLSSNSDATCSTVKLHEHVIGPCDWAVAVVCVECMLKPILEIYKRRFR